MIANEAGGGTKKQQIAVDDDFYLDWETRHETFQYHKHKIECKY